LRAKGEATEEPESPDNVGGLALTILYDGQPQPAVRESGAVFRVAPAAPNQTVTLRVTHLGGEKLAYVLQVNGRSTFQEQTGGPEAVQKWVIGAGQTYTHNGFMQDLQGNEVPFKVLTPEESQSAAAELGGKAGELDLDVFKQGSPGDGDEVTISTKNLSPR